MFLANMELAQRAEESAQDITADATAATPITATGLGVRYCRTKGRATLDTEIHRLQ